MEQHRFGGNWTEEKLQRLRAYLVQYRLIFKNNQKASYYKTWYVDAFAGTGTRTDNALGSSILFPNPEEPEVFAERNLLLDGSAKIALGIESPFDFYFFIEQGKKKAQELKKLVENQFPSLNNRITIEVADANEALNIWCKSRNWKRERAVVFLDPYGSQVSWETVKLLASTGGVDLWYLFPMVTRMLSEGGVVDETWRASLERLFGTAEWETRFYKTITRNTLFGLQEEQMRDARVENIQSFIEERLATCFPGVAKSRILRNSKSSPLYALCFAASSKAGHVPAVRIAQHLLNQ